MNTEQSNLDRQGLEKTPSPTEFQQCSPADCDSPPQSRQLSGHLLPSNATATRRRHLDRCNKPLNDSQNKERPNSTEQRYYLCEYSYEGARYSFKIPASSWKEAEARLRRMAYGRISGEIKAVIPAHMGWIAKAIVFLKNTIKNPAR